MTSVLDMLNIPPNILNIYPTSSTSPLGDLRKEGLEDVEDVEPKKNVRSTYLLSVVTLGSFLLRPVKARKGPISTRIYLVLNILNIFKNWHATSPNVHLARVLDDLAARRREALNRLARAHTRSPR